MRNFCVLAVTAVLAACATAAPVQPIANVQNVVYRVEDPAQKPVSAKPAEDSAPAGTSKPVHIYWFF